MANYYEYQAQNLRNRIDVYSKQRVRDEITGAIQHKYAIEKEGVFASVRLVRRRMRDGEAETKYGIITHEVLLRRKSVPNIDETFRFKYSNSNMSRPIEMKIISIDYDFDRDGVIYCRCEQVIE